MSKAIGGLGKGLSALLSDKEIYDAGSPGFFLCPIEKITPNPYQPRKTLNKDKLDELVSSIREKGILQPLVVRETPDGYELIAGERRWRAAQLAGLKTVPVIIKDVSPVELLELALIENIQRQDLNPLEEAMAFQRLIEEFGLSQAQVAEKVGKDRSTVANSLRLLKLPEFAREDIIEGRLTPGHARAILMLDDAALQKTLRDEILAKGLSVRQAESLARRLAKGGSAPKKEQSIDPDVARLCEELSRRLSSKVRIVTGKRGGRLEIHYRNLDELERLIDLIRSSA